MAEMRNNTTAEDTYLDAARASILAVGVRRTTLTDIARRAGVARMTLYRSWPDMLSLLGDLMTREWLEAADQVGADQDDDSAPAATRLVARVTATITTIRENALMRQIMDIDPEFLIPYLLQRRGRTQDQLLATMVMMVEAGQADGSIRSGEPTLLASSMMLAGLGFAVSMSTVTDKADPKNLDAELRLLLDRYIAP